MTATHLISLLSLGCVLIDMTRPEIESTIHLTYYMCIFGIRRQWRKVQTVGTIFQIPERFNLRKPVSKQVNIIFCRACHYEVLTLAFVIV